MLTLEGTFIDARWRLNPSPRPITSCVHACCFPTVTLWRVSTGASYSTLCRGSLGGFRSHSVHVRPHLRDLRKGDESEDRQGFAPGGGRGSKGSTPRFTKTLLLTSRCCPKRTHRYHTHKHQSPLHSHCTARGMGLCARSVCQSQQPGPNLTHGPDLGGAGTLTQQAAERRKRRASFGEREGGHLEGGGVGVGVCKSVVLGKEEEKENGRVVLVSVRVCVPA